MAMFSVKSLAEMLELRAFFLSGKLPPKSGDRLSHPNLSD
jgi:hypothetical protein